MSRSDTTQYSPGIPINNRDYSMIKYFHDYDTGEELSASILHATMKFQNREHFISCNIQSLEKD